jgi:hypothetical protein
MLNTDRAGNPHTINYDWLASDLAATTADHIFVFGHEPAYPVGPHLGNSLDAYPAERDAFWQLLVDHEVDIYFAGHEHLYNHVVVEGVHQVISGTCGAPIYTGYGGEFYHYVVVTVNGLDVSVQVFDDSGTLRDGFEYSRYVCKDGVDNDGDGLIDHPDDPGCFVPESDLEDPRCQDGEDNDGDGRIDFDGGLAALGYVKAEPDPQCESGPWLRSESPTGCGLGAQLTLVLPPLMWLHRRRSHGI